MLLNVPTYLPLTLSMCLLVSRFGPGLCRVEEDQEGLEIAYQTNNIPGLPSDHHTGKEQPDGNSRKEDF